MTPAELISGLAKAHIVARCLHVVAEAGVADALSAEGGTAAELAARTGFDAAALERILRLLAAHGIFAHAGSAAAGGCYLHTPASKLLRSDDPESMRSYVRMHAMPLMWNGVAELSQAARTGRPAREWTSLLAYFAGHPEEGRRFNEAMIAKSRRVVPAVVAAYDFSRFRVVADVAGGRGHLLRAILDAAPSVLGVLFELPHVIRDAASAASERLELMAGDFFEGPLPAADAYVLMDVLHDWADADAAGILRAIRRAAPSGAVLLVVETLVSDEPGPDLGKFLDVLMLAATGGRERAPSDYAALLASEGFRLDRVVRTRSPYSIVEASAVGEPLR